MPLFPYNRDIPDAPNDPSADQPLMKANTNNIDNIIDEDHFSFDENNGGLHRQVRLPLRGGSPGTIPPGLVAGEGTLYTKTVTSAGVLTETGLFYTPDNSADEYQLTRTITASKATQGTNTNYNGTNVGGWTFLPGGLLLQYGFITPIFNQAQTPIVYPVQFTSGPAFSIQVTAIVSNSTGDLSAAVRSGTSTATGFSASTSSSGTVTSYYWMAIGV